MNNNLTRQKTTRRSPDEFLFLRIHQFKDLLNLLGKRYEG